MRSFIIAALFPLFVRNNAAVVAFDPPIDALSVTLPAAVATADVRGFDGETWTQWFPLAAEEEFDPLLRESNLVVFPQPVERIELRVEKHVTLSLSKCDTSMLHMSILRQAQNDTCSIALHPIRVAKDPPRLLSASLQSSPYHLPPTRILSRQEWGADENILFAGEESQRSDVAPDQAIAAVENGNGVVPERLRECEEWQRKHPEDFRPARAVREDGMGRKYRWPLQYSTSVKLLVVHHTAQNIAGDARPPVERVRALYEYHANSRGWGDVGYHYIIDERGQMYEGRVGGDRVIGGHAYCWNTGTVSIALLGNFDVEQPKQAQMQSLQWLLADLARQYGIDLGSSVRMHGRNFPPIVGHRDLLQTDCPGYYVRETLSQVREHVLKGDLLATIRFPAILTARRAEAPRPRSSALVPTNSAPLLTPTGITLLQGRPGMMLPFSMQYRGGQSLTPQFARIADVEADQGIFLWQERGKRFVPVRNALQLPKKLGARETAHLRLNVQFPMKSGEYRLQIGPVRYTLLATGKRARAAGPSAPLPVLGPGTWDLETGLARGKATKHSVSSQFPVPSPQSPVPSPPIRIRLTFSDDTAVVLVPEGTTVNGSDIDVREVLLAERDGQCAAQARGKSIATGVVRLLSAGPIAFANKDGVLRRYNGILECRVIDSELTLINELPLEEYLLGLAEEPDSEPFEKQKAFAIAARSYAAHYLDPSRRKFQNAPYDGSDDPAVFQAYEGLTFAERNSNWVRAVRETAGKVLMKDGSVLRAAYFSSDDGRTRSPAEAGWSDFPHAETFASKPDPWCEGQRNRGHGVGMSGCGARGQAEEGKRAEEILRYYYPDTTMDGLSPSP